MTDLPPQRSRRASAARWTDAATGAAFGSLVWLELIAFGIPKLFADSHGYALIPVAVLVGAVAGWARVQRVLLTTAVVLAIPLTIVAFTPLIRWPARALVRSDRIGARPIQAIVVLSAGITTDGHLRQQALDRLLTGLSLVRRGLSSTLVITRERDGPPGRGWTSDADQQRALSLIERPIRLLVVDSIFSTRDEAVRTRALARTLDITGIALVTSPVHTYRACATFEKVGFAVTCVPSESRDVPLHTLRSPADRVRALQRVIYELVGLAKYQVSGWI